MAQDLGNGIEISGEGSADSLGIFRAGTFGGEPVRVRVVDTDADGLKRLRRERSVLIGLTSRYVLPWREIVAGALDADGLPTIVFVCDPPSGPTLADELTGGLVLTAAEAARLGADLALGLVALHAAGLAHGSIHPDLVRRDGEPGRGQTQPSARLSGVGVRSLAGGGQPSETEDLIGLAGLVLAVLDAAGASDEQLTVLVEELADPTSGRTARDAATRLATTSNRLASARVAVVAPRPPRLDPPVVVPQVVVPPVVAPEPEPVVEEPSARSLPAPAELPPVELRKGMRRGLLAIAAVVVFALIAGLIVIGHQSGRGSVRASPSTAPRASPTVAASPVLSRDLSAEPITAPQIGRAAKPLEGVSALTYNSLLQALYAYCDYYTPAPSTETGHAFVGYSSGIGINIYEDVTTYSGTGAKDLMAGIKQSIQQCPVLMAKDDAGNVLGTFMTLPVGPLTQLPAGQVGLLYKRTDMVEAAVQAVFLQQGDTVVVVLAQGRNPADLSDPLDRAALKALARIPTS